MPAPAGAQGAVTLAVDAMIRADDCGGTRPHLWMGGVRLLVREVDVEAALEVLTIEPRSLVDSDERPERQ